MDGTSKAKVSHNLGQFTYLWFDLLYQAEILTIEVVYKYPIAYPPYILAVPN